MPTTDPLIGEMLSEMRSNTPQTQNNQQSGMSTPTGQVNEDPLIGQLRDEQKQRYQESHAPTFNLNAPSDAQEPMAWSDVTSQGAKNFIPSAGRAVYGMVEPFMHPITTAENIYGLGKGAYSKAKGAMGYQQDPEQKAKDEAQVNALVNYYGNRYGSKAGFQHALAEDPASVLLDLSVPFTFGESALARVPGVLGKVGEAGVLSKLSNPVAAVGAAGKLAGKVPLGGLGGYGTLGEAAGAMGEKAATAVLSPLSGAANISPGALPTAFKAGLAGGEAAENLAGQMRGSLGTADILDKIDGTIGNIANTRKAEYIQGMGGLKNAPSISDFTPIQKAADDAIASIAHYPTAAPTRNTIRGLMDDFKSGQIGEYKFDPASPTLFDYDKLKQALWDVSKDPRTPQGAVVGDVARAVRKEIGNTSKEYGNIMDRYGDLSDQLKDIRTTLGGSNLSDISRIRKAMSALGKEDKMSVLQEMAKHPGGEDLINQLTGRELSDWSHGSGSGGLLGGLGGYGLSYAMGSHPGLAIPGAIAGMYARSPRALGETAYRAGAGIRNLKNASPAVSLPLAEMGHYQMLGDESQRFETNPYMRTGHASGGRAESSAASKANVLINMVDKIRKEQGNETKPLLNLDDNTVAKALAVANRGI